MANQETDRGVKGIAPDSMSAGSAHAAVGRTSAAGFGSPNAATQAYAARTVNKPRSAHEAAPPVTEHSANPEDVSKRAGRVPSFGMPLGSTKRAPENF